MGTKVRHWTGEHDSNGRQVYEEHQGRTQVYDTAEIWKAAVHSDTYRKWQYDKFMQTSPLVDSDGVMYSRSSHSPLKEKAVKNLSQTHLGLRVIGISYEMFRKGRCFCCKKQTKRDLCPCPTHTSIELKLDALNKERRLWHKDGKCNCECSLCKNNHKEYFKMTEDVTQLSECFMCGKGEGNVSCSRKLQCAQRSCCECRDAKLQCCPKEAEADFEVKYQEFQNVQHQAHYSSQEELRYNTKPVTDLIKEIEVEFDKTYRQHNFDYRWQNHQRLQCIANMTERQMIFEYDFSNRYEHRQRKELTCTHPKTTSVLVLLVHHSPKFDGQGEKVGHKTDCYQVWSDDIKQDPFWHWTAYKKVVSDFIVRYSVDTTPETAATKGPLQFINWSDGCGEQNKGRRHFRKLTEFPNWFLGKYNSSCMITHNLACSHHFAGVHDGEGGRSKDECSKTEIEGTLLVNAEQCVQQLSKKMARTQHTFQSPSREGERNDKEATRAVHSTGRTTASTSGCSCS